MQDDVDKKEILQGELGNEIIATTSLRTSLKVGSNKDIELDNPRTFLLT